jgi:hypothetical protein
MRFRSSTLLVVTLRKHAARVKGLEVGAARNEFVCDGAERCGEEPAVQGVGGWPLQEGVIRVSGSAGRPESPHLLCAPAPCNVMAGNAPHSSVPARRLCLSIASRAQALVAAL